MATAKTPFDNSWKALTDPGRTVTFCDQIGTVNDMSLDHGSYSHFNSWFLAYISWLSYRRGKNELYALDVTPSRQEILRRAGLQETCFLERKGIQVALLSSKERAETVRILVFRGTDSFHKFCIDARFLRHVWEKGGSVHAGFRRAFLGVWDHLSEHLPEGMENVFYTGHSLGAALAILAASTRKPSAVYTFGAPRVGDREFAETLSDTPVYRVVNNKDLVCRVPFTIGSIEYTHVGELHFLNATSEQSSSWFPVSPPKCLVDHAPGNYHAVLERLMS